MLFRASRWVPTLATDAEGQATLLVTVKAIIIVGVVTISAVIAEVVAAVAAVVAVVEEVIFS